MLIHDKSIKLNDSTVNHNGFAVFKDVPIAKAGNIQEYMYWELPNLPDELTNKEIIKIYRPKKEVKKSVETFNFLTVTDQHPDEDVTTKNFRDYAVGLSTDAKFKDGHIVSSSLVITDSDTIVLLQSNSNSMELSVGYTAEVVYESGVTKDGEEYDGYFKNYVANHIALVEKGRCGGSCKL